MAAAIYFTINHVQISFDFMSCNCLFKHHYHLGSVQLTHSLFVSTEKKQFCIFVIQITKIDEKFERISSIDRKKYGMNYGNKPITPRPWEMTPKFILSDY